MLLFISLRDIPDLCPKGADLGVKTSAPSCPLTLPLYQRLPTEQAENQGTLPAGAASVLVDIQTVPIAARTIERLQKVNRRLYRTNFILWAYLKRYNACIGTDTDSRLESLRFGGNYWFGGLPGGSDSKVSARDVGDRGLIPGSGKSPGEGNGNPLQNSCLENFMDGGAWWATVHGVAKSQTRLSNFTAFGDEWLEREIREKRQHKIALLPTGSQVVPTVSYKLALTKSTAKYGTTKAFAICLYGKWTPSCYSCWPSTTPEGNQGGVGHSVLQGIWWDRPLDSWMFSGTDFMISILASPHI